MISGKLVHLIELHWDQIVTRVIDQVHREPQLARTRQLVESELRDWGEALLQNLGHWLSAGNEEELALHYEKRGKALYEEGVPLFEAVQCLTIVRQKIMDFVEEHILSKSTMELYAEEELERRLGRFFDLLSIHLVKGYEHALRKTVAARA